MGHEGYLSSPANEEKASASGFPEGGHGPLKDLSIASLGENRGSINLWDVGFLIDSSGTADDSANYKAGNVLNTEFVEDEGEFGTIYPWSGLVTEIAEELCETWNYK